MSKDLNISALLDFYGALLTPRRTELMRMYYDDDMSLAEIAAETGTTRQAAQEAIRRGGERLRELESGLMLQKRYMAAMEAVRLIENGEPARAAACLRSAWEE